LRSTAKRGVLPLGLLDDLIGWNVFFIEGLEVFGHFGPIHLLSALAL